MIQIGYLRVQHILDQDVDGIFGPRKDNLVKCFQSDITIGYMTVAKNNLVM